MRRFTLTDALALLMVAAYALLAFRTTAGDADPQWRSSSEKGVLIVGTDAGFRPFVDLQNDQFVGYDVELVQEIGRRLGREVQFVHVGYDGLFPALASGKVHMIAAGVPHNPDQAWVARFSRPYFDAGLQLLVVPESPIQTAEDLADGRVAVALGSPADTEARRLRRQLPDLEILSTPLTPSEALSATLAGEADAAIVDGPAAEAAINAGLARRVKRLTYEPYVLAVPSSAYQLQEQLDVVLADLQREGFIARLNARWFR